MDSAAPIPALQAHIAELHALWQSIQSQIHEQMGAGTSKFNPAAVSADWPHWSTEKQQNHLRELRQGFRLVRERFHQYFIRLAREIRNPSQSATDKGPGIFPFRLDRLIQFPDQRPIFILGMPRSGTTAMGNALRHAPRMFGWVEGHVFSKLPPLLNTMARTWSQRTEAENHEDASIAVTHLDLHRFLNQTIRVCNEFYDQATAQAGALRWIDKSPGYFQLVSVPILHHVYPQAHFIHMHRHPLKRILSRLRYRGGGQSIEMALFVWVITMDLWTELRRQLPPESCRDVAQTDLSLRTDDLIAQLGPFLGLESDQAETVRRYLAQERPLDTASSRDSDPCCLEDLDWSEEVKSWCREMGEPMALAWSYRLTRT